VVNALPPVIKWPGSKRAVALALSRLFPKAERYFEPCVGGGALLPFRPSKSSYASDTVSELIALWLTIRDKPQDLADGYRDRWAKRQKEGHTVYYFVRDRFNRTRDPIDFFFLSRTCVNGLIRFNKRGAFNNSLHHTRPGMAPDKLEEIIFRWSRAVQGVSFASHDYRSALSDVRRGDFVFLDPPYEATRGRYRAEIFDAHEFRTELARLNSVGAKWMLTYDGEAGERSYTGALPGDLYKLKLRIATGQSPFTRLMGTAVDPVTESVYLNYEPPGQLGAGAINEAQEPIQLSVCFDV
jgi:DNA adenine methylase